MKRLTGSMLAALFVVLFVTSGSSSVARAQDQSMDRTVLPIAGPTYPPITELDARKAKVPPLFQLKAPQGAPNVIVILLDNLGFGATKPFGGVINMPTLERLAKSGLIYTNFHTAPLCSPSRMALLTGRNAQSVNMGTISEMASAFPGQTSVLPASKAALPEIMKLNGYSTAMFGKSHEFTAWETGLTGYNQIPETVADQLKHLAEFGGPHSAMTPPIGWAIADNTPFAYAQGNTSYGGTTNGVVIYWPKVIKSKGEVRFQYHHLIDIAPTVLEAAGLPEPMIVNSAPQNPMEGVSMDYSFSDSRAKSPHTAQFAEFQGNRGIYKDGWYATSLHKVAWEAQPRSSFDQDKWQLFNTTEDFSCAIDLAAKNPDKLKEMQTAFLTEAVKYNVLPLDDRVYERFNPIVAGRPDLMAGRTSLTVYEGMIGMKENAFINTKNSSYSITGEVEVPQSAASGVILARAGLTPAGAFMSRTASPNFCNNILDKSELTCYLWLRSTKHERAKDFAASNYTLRGRGKLSPLHGQSALA